MRILGIDPGTLRMGVGVLETQGNRAQLVAFESVEFSASLPLPERLKEIYDSVRSFIERYSPDVLALENVFYGKDVRALVKMGEARASAMLAAAEKKVPVVEYPPARIKQAVSGNGRASKVQIQQMTKHLLGLKAPPPVDAADALAVALCHVQCQQSTRFYERVREDRSHPPPQGTPSSMLRRDVAPLRRRRMPLRSPLRFSADEGGQKVSRALPGGLHVRIPVG